MRNAIKNVRKNLLNDIFQWLLSKGVDVSYAESLTQDLPIVFAIGGDNKWCFVIDEQIRRFETVLAVSVIVEKTAVIDGYFLLSVQDFSRTDFIVFSQNDPLYSSSKVEINSPEEIIKLLIK
ncbi:MAG: hypothetical protein LBN95_07925 [Prevotellaceae bacterium]|nr:hypothetical protein [Prevotellaceae bacterium]